MGMHPQTFDINGNVPVAIAASPLPEPLTVLNMEVESVIYLSAEPGNKGFPLSPGSTMTWDVGQRLYVTTDDATTARIGVVYNGGQIIDSRALARQIVSAGLADDIAEKISLAGVPTIDRPKILTSGSGYVATNGKIIDNADVSGYSTITGYIETDSAENRVITMYVTQATDDSFLVSTTNTYTFATGAFRFDIPLVANHLTVELTEPGVNEVQFKATIVASYRDRAERIVSLPKSWESVQMSGTGSEGGTWADLTLAPGRTLYYPWWQNGPVNMTWGFTDESNADLNTVGIGVIYGSNSPNTAGLTTYRSRGNLGNPNFLGTNVQSLQTYSGYNGRAVPRLIVTNNNNVSIDINFSLTSPI